MTVAAPAITLAEAKERVRIPDLWHEFGYRGEPGKTCFCPFHEDTRTPAFSVFDDGKRWECHAGCGEGSVVDLFAKRRRARCVNTNPVPSQYGAAQPVERLQIAEPRGEAVPTLRISFLINIGLQEFFYDHD